MLPANGDIAAMLARIARLFALREESPYRILAYEKAAEAIAEYPASAAELALRGELRTLPGVGRATEAAVLEYLETGRITLLDTLQGDYPEGIFDLLNVPGLGPRKVRTLWEELRVGDLPALRKACLDGRVASVPGMGKKTQDRLLAALDQVHAHPSRRLLGVVDIQADRLIQALRSLPQVAAADIAGSLRRRRSTVKDIDLVAAGEDPASIMESFAMLPDIALVQQRGPAKMVALTHTGMSVDLRVCVPAAYGNLLQHATGSAEHNAALRAYAQDRGLKVSEHGIESAGGGAVFLAAREEDVYRHLGLQWIPPELRENQGEIAAAATGGLPHLISRDDLQGDLHVHSLWSDGRSSILEMAVAARSQGLRYICICDHSRSLGVTRGLDISRLEQQREEIAIVNEQVRDVRVLAGIEVDILADGSLALPDEVLARLDFVVASIHTALAQPEPQITRRLLNAMRNPHVDAIGHPTGRLLLRRPAYDVDLDAVLKAAAETGTALEINSSFERLDLPGRMVRRAASMGVRFVINSDAHHVTGFELLGYGISEARRGWLEPSDVLNTRPWHTWAPRGV